MTIPAERAPDLRLSSLSDLLESVPALLHFRPEASLVVVVVERGLLAVTARIDLDACLQPDTLDLRLGPLWARYQEALFIAIAYTEDGAHAWDCLARLADEVPLACDLSLLHADGRRWYDAPGEEGTPYDDRGGILTARAVYEGIPVRDSRTELRATLDTTAPAQDAAAAHREVVERGLGTEELVGEGLALVESFGNAPRALTLTEAALLCEACVDLAFREAAILSTSRRNAAVRVDLWTQVVRGCLPGRAGYPLIVLGVAAWVSGEGALQVCCLERVAGLPTDDDWRTFLDLVNARVVPPSEWDQIRADYLCRSLEPSCAED